MTDYSRGDTIIEVLLAITIFSLVSVGGIALMNQGTAIAQRALEIDLVRQQMDAQADALRFLNRQYLENPDTSAVWKNITAKATSKAQPFNDMIDGSGCKIVDSYNPFALDIKNMTVISNKPTKDSATYAQVSYDVSGTPRAEGIWVNAVKSSDADPTKLGFYDFHIRTCWNTPGQSTPITLGTIVRLYEPKN